MTHPPAASLRERIQMPSRSDLKAAWPKVLAASIVWILLLRRAVVDFL